MKKVKIMLTAIIVLAVVGGTLAFKAQKFTKSIYCTTSTDSFCRNLVNATINEIDGQGVLSDPWRCTDAANSGDVVCPETTVFTND